MVVIKCACYKIAKKAQSPEKTIILHKYICTVNRKCRDLLLFSLRFPSIVPVLIFGASG